MTVIVLASDNAGKLQEFHSLTEALPIELVSQSRFDVPSVEETGGTFVENAILKARNACVYSGAIALADDSGLEVDALKGEPGVYSARYAGEHGNAKANIDKLLLNLTDVPEDKRTARFRCVLVLMRHHKDPAPIIAQGIWEGRILTRASGKNGFGYDPVFFVPEKDCSVAKFSAEEKNQLSHRAKALKKLLVELKSHVNLVS